MNNLNSYRNLGSLHNSKLEPVIWPLKMGILSVDKIQRAIPLIGLIAVLLAQSEHTVDRVLCAKWLAASVSLLVIWLVLIARLNTIRSIPINGSKLSIFFLLYLLLSLPVFHPHAGADQWFEWNKRLLQFISISLFTIWFQWLNLAPKKILKAGLFLAATLTIIGLFELIPFISLHKLTHETSYSFTGTFAHRNIFAEILLLSLPFPFAYFLITKKGKYLAIVLVSLILTFILIALSRAVWISLLVASVILLIANWIVKPKLASGRFIAVTINKKYLLWIPAILAVSITFFFMITETNDFKNQVMSLFSTGFGSGNERIQLWKKSILVFKENPITGHGLGSWKIEVLKYGHKGLITEDNLTFHQRPHNDYLWIACESGLSGLISYLLWLGSLLYLIVKQIKRASSAENALLFRAILFSLISYTCISFFSFPSERIEHGFILSLFSGVILAYTPHDSKGKTPIKSILVLLTLLLPLLEVFYCGYQRYRAESELGKAYQARASGDWHKVIQNIQRSEDLGLHIDPMCTPLRWYSGSAWYNLGDQKMALNDFKEAYRMNPYHVHVLNNLATEELLTGHADSAILYYKKALKIAPGFKDASLNLVAAYFNTGKSREAMNTLQSIEPDSTDKRYLQTVSAVTRAEVLRLKDSVTCHDLSLRIASFANVKKWPDELFFKAKKEKRSYSTQVLADAIFLLDRGEKENNRVYLHSLKHQYPSLKTNE